MCKFCPSDTSKNYKSGEHVSQHLLHLVPDLTDENACVEYELVLYSPGGYIGYLFEGRRVE